MANYTKRNTFKKFKVYCSSTESFWWCASLSLYLFSQDKLRRIAGTRDLSTVNALALVLDTKSADRSFGAVRGMVDAYIFVSFIPTIETVCIAKEDSTTSNSSEP